MIGRLDHSRVLRMMSIPSMSGSPRSSRTRSGSDEVISASPSLPLLAAVTLYSCESSVLPMKSQILFSSSMINTDIF